MVDSLVAQPSFRSSRRSLRLDEYQLPVDFSLNLLPMSVAIRFDGVSFVREGRSILRDISWQVNDGERWAILGPNGCGKTTSLKLAGAQLHPSSGAVHVLGSRLGRVDLRELRKRIAFVSASISRTLSPDIVVRDVVLSGIDSVLVTYWSEYSDSAVARAETMMKELDLVDLVDREFGVVSEGERQRVLLARALMKSPELLLLDEPFAGLDLGARERLLARLSSVFTSTDVPAIALVTHHVEEIPPGTTHAVLMREGCFVANGPIHEILTTEAVSNAFDVDVRVVLDNGRWSAR